MPGAGLRKVLQPLHPKGPNGAHNPKIVGPKIVGFI